VANGKARGFGSPFSSSEDEPRDPSGRLEEGLARILRLPVDPEKIPLELCSNPNQSLDLLSFSVDAAPIHSEEDHGRKAKIPGKMIDAKRSIISWQSALKNKTDDGFDSVNH
jgi:hypothetical protein